MSESYILGLELIEIKALMKSGCNIIDDRIAEQTKILETKIEQNNKIIETELERNNILLERIIKILENNMTSKE